MEEKLFLYDLSIRRINKLPSARVGELCRVEKGMDKVLIKVSSDGLAI